MKITPAKFRGDGAQLEKRTYLPFVVESKCPTCGKNDKRDLRSDYLSYPQIGVAEEIHFAHGEYGAGDYHEWSESVVIGFTLTEAK